MEAKNDIEVQAEQMALDLIQKICDVSPEVLSTAFSQVNEYKQITIKKRNGTNRNISAPKKELLFVQRKLLKQFFYRLGKKNIYGDNGRDRYIKSEDLHVNKSLTGFVPGKSFVDNARIHTTVNTNYVLHLDIQDAFPSVKTFILIDFLKNAINREIRSYQSGYAERKEFFRRMEVGKVIISRIGLPPKGDNELKTWRYDGSYIVAELMPDQKALNPWDLVQNRTFCWVKYYPGLPLFPANKFSIFRRLIREVKMYENNKLLEAIIKKLVSKIVLLTTFNGELPQGAATSGFLFNLVVSQFDIPSTLKSKVHGFEGQKSSTFSMYADDITIGTIKKPSKKFISSLEKALEKYGYLNGYDFYGFRVNKQKTKVYARKSFSPVITGCRLIKKPATAEKLKELVEDHITGTENRLKKSGIWLENQITLPKKLQKKIRGLIHQATKAEIGDKIHSKITGYLGLVAQIYGNSIDQIPGQLSVPIIKYSQKFKLKLFSA